MFLIMSIAVLAKKYFPLFLKIQLRITSFYRQIKLKKEINLEYIFYYS
jgi:hypothetical protein